MQYGFGVDIGGTTIKDWIVFSGWRFDGKMGNSNKQNR